MSQLKIEDYSINGLISKSIIKKEKVVETKEDKIQKISTNQMES